MSIVSSAASNSIENIKKLFNINKNHKTVSKPGCARIMYELRTVSLEPKFHCRLFKQIVRTKHTPI